MKRMHEALKIRVMHCFEGCTHQSRTSVRSCRVQLSKPRLRRNSTEGRMIAKQEALRSKDPEGENCEASEFKFCAAKDPKGVHGAKAT